MLRYRKLEWFSGNLSRLQTWTKDVMSIGAFFIAGKLEVFVEVLKNNRRSCDCLDIVHRRDGAFIGAIDNFKTGSPTATVQQAPAPQPPVASSSVEEEHAAHLESGEETGAAAVPTGQAPEGEYASHEEVGSPDAPTQGAAS